MATLPVASHLCRPDGALFGGTALAATLALLEQTTGRPALWATVQFVGSATAGERITCTAELGARGGYIDQVRIRGAVEDRVVFDAVGAAATPRAGGITGVGVVMPDVPPPEDCAPFGGPSGVMIDLPPVGHHTVSEYRAAPLRGAGGDDPGSVALWARLNGERATTSAKLGFLGDMVPIAVCRAAGVAGAGTSLDNSIRIAKLVDSEWLLVHLQAHAASDGYGYGVGHFWTPDGQLLGTSSQTAKLFSVDSIIQRRMLAAPPDSPDMPDPSL